MIWLINGLKHRQPYLKMQLGAHLVFDLVWLGLEDGKLTVLSAFVQNYRELSKGYGRCGVGLVVLGGVLRIQIYNRHSPDS